MKKASVASSVVVPFPIVALACTLAGCGGGGGGGDEQDSAVDTTSDTEADAADTTPSDTLDDTQDDPGPDTALDSAPDPEPDAEDAPDSPTDASEDVDAGEGGDGGPGSSCLGTDDCAPGSECVAGEYTAAYCAPLCSVDGDCWNEATGQCGICTDAPEFRFCMFFCNVGGFIAGCSFTAVCPGDMTCDGAVCR